MPLVAQVFRKIWAEMPELVTDCADVTWNNNVADKFRRGYLLHVLKNHKVAIDTNGIATNVRLDDGMADVIKKACAEGLGEIEEFVRWANAFRAVDPRLKAPAVRRNARAQTEARVKVLQAASGGSFPTRSRLAELPDSERVVLARKILAEKQARPPLDSERVSQFGKENSQALSSLLNECWASSRPEQELRVESNASECDLAPYATLLSTFRIWQASASDREALTGSWNELLAKPLVFPVGFSALLGLASSAEIPVPRLFKKHGSVGRGDSRYPLELSIERRITKPLNGKQRIPIFANPDDAWRVTIRGSVRPCGFVHPWADHVMVLGYAASQFLSQIGSNDALWGEPDKGSTASRLQSRYRNKIRTCNYVTGANPVQPDQLTSDQQSQLLGRLWTRVQRLCLTRDSPPTVFEAWSEISGAFYSAMQNLLGVSLNERGDIGAEIFGPRGRVDPEVAAHSEPDPPAELGAKTESTFIGEIYWGIRKTAVETYGQERVDTFWRSLEATTDAPEAFEARKDYFSREWESYVELVFGTPTGAAFRKQLIDENRIDEDSLSVERLWQWFS